MTTSLYDASVYGRETKIGAGLEYLAFDMRLEEEEEADVDEIEELKKRRPEPIEEETTQRRERDQNSEQRKLS